jgi:hypothetical protein
MVTYMKIPQLLATITHLAVAYTPEVQTVDVKRIENGFDSATICIADTKSLNYGVRAAAGDAITLQVKDASDAGYTTIFSGIIRVCLPSLNSKGQFLLLKCDGSGFGLVETLCGQEFGSDSRNPTLATIRDIVGDGVTPADVGILHAWVNHYLGDTGTASGYAYTRDVNVITGPINYICFPYKPSNRCVDDLCDLVTAIRQDAAYAPDNCGPHWIVDTDNVFRMKLVNGTQAAWTKYYGNSATAATLEQGIDFVAPEFQDLDPEANCVLYYGNWRRPSNGDSWTESSVTDWGCDATNTLSLGTAKVGSKSVKSNNDDAISQELSAWTPLDREAAFDFSWCTEFSTPTINFWARRSGACALFYLYLHTCTGGVPDGSYWTDLTASLALVNTWYHFSFPVGPYYNVQESPSFAWTVDGTPNWAAIDDVYFHAHCGQNIYINIDGLHFGGAPILRVAKNSTSINNPAIKLRTRIIVDDVGKDDSLLAGDDSGLMAQLAYAELLRLQTSPKIGTMTTPMIKDLLPGQWLHIHALTKADGTPAVFGDMRVTELHHTISEQGFLTTIQVTNDLTSSHTRTRYNDINKVQAAFRPEFQDRQAASIKAGTVDIRVLKLEHDYP